MKWKLPIWQPLPPGRTAEAQRELEQFISRYKNLADQINAIPLTILVWGPHLQPETAVSRKRRDIRQALIACGHNACFSEELTALVPHLSLSAQESAQARAVHLIILLLEDAPGALGELHEFCTDPDIAWKVFVMVPIRYKHGFSGRGLLSNIELGYGGVYWYEEGELEQCTVLGRAVMRAQARRELYAARSATRGTAP